MKFKALRVFIDVVDKQTFTDAARNHQLTQSAVSQSIGKLERSVGARLLVRSNRSTTGTTPTELGQVYYEGCKRLIENFDELEASIRQANAQMVVHIRVAAIYSVGLGNMGQYIERFKAAEPRAEVHIDYLHPDRVYER